MAKQKSLEQLRAEKEQVEKRLAQEQHKLERLENRKKYLEKGERQKRTHRLCNLGGSQSCRPDCKGGGCVSCVRLSHSVSSSVPIFGVCAVPEEAVLRLALFRL